MTTIIGIQGDGYALMVGDSRISDMSRDGELFGTSTLGGGLNKIANSKQFLIGTAGDLRAINLVAHAFTPPAPPSDTGKELDAYVTVKFIPELMSCFDTHGYDMSDKESSDQGSTIMIAVNGIIYVIDSDYSWITNSSGIYAIGTGCEYALGALEALVNDNKLEMQEAKRVALKAIAIAAKYDPGTGGPYLTHTQEPATRPKAKSGRTTKSTRR